MTSTFYRNIQKTSQKVTQNHIFEMDTLVRYGDVVETKLPLKGPYISKIYLNLLDIPANFLEYMDFIYNDQVIFRWSGDSIQMEYYLTTDFQKQTYSDSTLSFNTFNIPVLYGMKIKFKVNNPVGNQTKNFIVSADYIYSKNEKDGIYLIEQIQKNTFNYTPNIRNTLRFKNICKELYFAIDGISGTSDKISNLSIFFNNVEKVSDGPIYFRLVQPYTNHTSAPLTSQGTCFYIYSFSLYPEERQPSGGVNMSRVQNVAFSIVPNTLYTPKVIDVYARTYNLFIVEGENGRLLNNFL